MRKRTCGLFLSYQTRCRSVGVEYDSRIYETVCENKRHAVSGSRTEFVRGNAENYVVPAEVDRVFFFNPFSVEILRKVLAKLKIPTMKIPVRYSCSSIIRQMSISVN